MAEDIVITCENCKQQFVFTKDEQAFYAQKGLSKPTYCLICRSLLKTAQKDSFRGSTALGSAKDKKR